MNVFLNPNPNTKSPRSVNLTRGVTCDVIFSLHRRTLGATRYGMYHHYHSRKYYGPHQAYFYS